MTKKDANDLSSIDIEPTQTATHSVIWLHGLGADGHDFVPIVSELKLPSEAAIRFVFPHAPIMPVTINNGYQMRAWFDILSLSIDGPIDREGIAKSVQAIHQLIEKEIARGIASDHITLAGFSQGAALALTAGLSFNKPLAGIIALSGYLPFAEEVTKRTNVVNQQLPIFIAHGTQDAVLPFALGQMTYAALSQAGFPVTWGSYEMAHTVCPEELMALRKWLLATNSY